MVHLRGIYHPDEFLERGKPLSFAVLRFIKFMVTEIFPAPDFQRRR